MSTQTTPLPKLKLISTAAELVYKQGWNATGINQILGEAQVPKGSFYYYFQSKEDLGVAIVKHHGERFEHIYAATVLNDQLTGRQGIENYFLEAVRQFKSSGLRWGCPVGTFSNEVADSTAKIAEACREFLSRFLVVFQIGIERGQKDGSIKSTHDAAILALELSAIWQGALLCMKTMRSELPLEVVLNAMSKKLSNE